MERNRVFYLIDKEGLHTYTIKVKEKKSKRIFKLFHSLNTETTNILLCKIRDNGNGVKITICDHFKENLKLDYHQLEYLSILTRFATLYGEDDHINTLVFDIIEHTNYTTI